MGKPDRHRRQCTGLEPRGCSALPPLSGYRDSMTILKRPSTASRRAEPPIKGESRSGALCRPPDPWLRRASPIAITDAGTAPTLAGSHIPWPIPIGTDR